MNLTQVPSRERKDARANHERILIAAREECALRGTSIEMKDVAARAGVGVGTLYRHFESREKLIAAVIADARRSLLERTSAAVASASPVDAFRAIIRMGAEAHEQYGALHEVAVPDAHEKAEFIRLFDGLIRRAIEEGAFRRDLDPRVLWLAIESLFMSGALQELAKELGHRAAADAFSQLILSGCATPETRRSIF